MSEKQFWKQVDELRWPMIRLSKDLDFNDHKARLLKKKPIEYWNDFRSIVDEKSERLNEKLKLGSNDFALDFTADIVGHGQDLYNRMMSDQDFAEKRLDSECFGVENFTYLIPSPPRNSGTPDISKRELADALLIARCRKLWDSYFEKPTKKNLRDVLSHLEEMKSSKNEAVAKERSKCLREANKEAKRLKVK